MNTLYNIKTVLQRICSLAARFIAGTVILLALLVGIARLLLPEAANFKDDIRTGVKTATGYNLDFEMISVGLSAYGPELRLSAVTLAWPDGAQLVHVDGVAVSLDVFAWVSSGQLLPGRILLEGAVVDVTVDADGQWFLQDRPWKDFVSSEGNINLEEFPESRLQLADVVFGFTDESGQRPPVNAVIKSLDAILRDMQLEISAEVFPGIELSKSLELEAELPVRLLLENEEVAADQRWQLRLYADDLHLQRALAVMQIEDLPITNTTGDITVQVGLIGLRAMQVSTELNLEEIELLPQQPGDAPLIIDSLTAQLDWSRQADGWVAVGQGVRIDRGARSWDEGQYRIDYRETKAGQQRIVASANFLRLEDILPLLQAAAPQQLADAGFTATVAGDISALNLTLDLQAGKVTTFSVDGAFADLGYATADGALQVIGVSGHLTADTTGGNLQLATEDALLIYRRLFRDALEVSSLQGLAIWRVGDEGYRVLADGIQLQTPYASASASLELAFDNEFKNPFIDLTATASMDDATNVNLYLPLILSEKVISWLDGGIKAARVPAADFKLRGPLTEFPFDHGEGEFLIHVDFVDGQLDYAPGWPGITATSGQLVFDGVSLYSTSNTLQVANTTITNIDMRMNDMRNGELTLSGAGRFELENLLEFLQQTPIADALGPVFADLRASGQGDASMELTLPIKQMDLWKLDSRIRVENATAGLISFADRFTNLSGEARINNIDVSVDGMTGSFLGRPVSIDVLPVTSPTSGFSHRAMVSGNFAIERLRNMVGLPEVAFLAGEVDLTAQALFPGTAANRAPFRLAVRSDLIGMVSTLPFPLDKEAATAEGVQIEIEFPERNINHIYGSVERGFSWAVELQQDAKPWMLTRGAVLRDVKYPAMPVEPGLIISGELDSFSLDDWIAQFANDEVGAAAAGSRRWQQMFRAVNLQVGELDAMGHHFVDVDAAIGFYAGQWDMQFTGPWIEGRVVLPYDFTGAEPAVLDMERLLLIEPLESGDAVEKPLDPRSLPSLQGRVSDLAIGSLRLGRADIDIVRVRDGLRSRSFLMQSDSFNTSINYDWLVIDNAQRSRLHLQLDSTDAEETLVQLGYSPLIDAERSSVTGDLLWEGGPGLAAIYESTGSIGITIRDGQIKKVDTGGGRLLGLLSITALPRRFAFDFTDVADGALPFDKISGNFRIDFGDAWTCNLGLEGGVADMGIVGHTSFLNEDYDQVAAVRPHVSNIAPVAFLAGPAVGIATLLVTQMLRKPLSSIGESYYTIRGSFAEPAFEKVDRQSLDTAAYADCEQQLPTLSPEEIAAIKDLLEGEPQPVSVPDAAAAPAATLPEEAAVSSP